jgi:hypothetical protein
MNKILAKLLIAKKMTLLEILKCILKTIICNICQKVIIMKMDQKFSLLETIIRNKNEKI